MCSSRRVHAAGRTGKLQRLFRVGRISCTTGIFIGAGPARSSLLRRQACGWYPNWTTDVEPLNPQIPPVSPTPHIRYIFSAVQPGLAQLTIAPGGVAFCHCRRSPVGVNPAWRIGHSSGSNQSGEGGGLSTPLSDSAVTEGTLLTSEHCDVLGVTTEVKAERRVLAGEASRRARCGKSARRVR